MALYVGNFYSSFQEEPMSEITGVFDSYEKAIESLFYFLLNNEYIFILNDLRKKSEEDIDEELYTKYFNSVNEFNDFVKETYDTHHYKKTFDIFLKKIPESYHELDNMCEEWASHTGYETEWNFSVETCVLNEQLSDDRAE